MKHTASEIRWNMDKPCLNPNGSKKSKDVVVPVKSKKIQVPRINQNMAERPAYVYFENKSHPQPQSSQNVIEAN